jgi:hypothetical protein
MDEIWRRLLCAKEVKFSDGLNVSDTHSLISEVMASSSSAHFFSLLERDGDSERFTTVKYLSIVCHESRC